ncbi:MAG: 2Fe-2S iron-sulfur cluster binding domain-containing protein [Planctomycetes bacterium]|nr:2Fe-2S iron-sulfur cluster binding domain-containing protein [Planctomycetota bacterium]
MSFVPVLIISLILLVVTILLAIADRLLVNYGECKITVSQEDEATEFAVQGGGFLHTELSGHGIKITSSCGGKASCGYCKCQVTSGGGSILPTEEIFMDREEKLAGMRLACQVKVKEDLEILIPDFLTTVRGIVEKKSYDPKLQWNFIKDGYEDFVPEKQSVKLSADEKNMITSIIDDYEDSASAAVPIMQRLSSEYNYLPESALRYTAKQVKIPVSQIHRLATFYNAFSLEPKGKSIIKVCMGTACYVKGGQRILDTVRRKLDLQDSDVTKDLKFSVETVSCIGCCGQSPVMSVDGEIYGYLHPSMIGGILEKHDRD